MPLIIPANTLVPTVAHDVANSCRFNTPDSPDLTRACSTPTDNLKYTISFWFKRSLLSDDMYLMCAKTDGNNYFHIRIKSDDNMYIWDVHSGGSPSYQLTTNRKFRDVSAWYHLVYVYDSANATAGNRMRLYINGTEETSFSSDVNPAQDYASNMNKSGVDIEIGQMNDLDYFGGYMAEVCMVDGQALTPTSFGEFDSDSPTIWKPKDPSGLTFGNNGFYLDFEASDNLGNDANGGTDFTATNLDATDQATDSPTNNFAVFNILGSNSESISEGSLYASQRASTDFSFGCATTIGVKKGKWYCEWECTDVGTQSEFGIHKGNTFLSIAGDYEYQAGALYYGSAGLKYIAGSSSAYGDSWTSGDIISIALDMDNRDVYFYKNGVIQDSGTAAFDSSYIADDTYYFPFGAGYNTGICQANFGGCDSFTVSSGNADANGYGNFEYAVPNGYYALCTKNLAEFG